MKLANVYAANAVIGKLAQMRMNPKTAYAVLKYARNVEAEMSVIEKTRVAIIREITNTKDGEEAKIEPNTPMFDEYVSEFGAVLDVDADLEPSELQFDDVLSAISADQSNALTIQEIGVLEPFFTT